MALAARIARDAGELGDQVRHDHQQDKPHKSVHGRDDYLQGREGNRRAIKGESSPYIVVEAHARRTLILAIRTWTALVWRETVQNGMIAKSSCSNATTQLWLCSFCPTAGIMAKT